MNLQESYKEWFKTWLKMAIKNYQSENQSQPLYNNVNIQLIKDKTEEKHEIQEIR